MIPRRISELRREAWTYLPEFAQETLPRYTSYPPANRFTPQIGAADAMAALRGLSAGATLSLYVHIPYCRQLCWYCGCHTSVPTRADPTDTYLDAVHAEIDLICRVAPEGARVTHLHFGGGSPDALSPAEAEALMDHLRAAFNFAPDAEIAAELDPRGASQEFIAVMADAGLTRASLGVQVLDPGVQRRINRIQSAETIETAAFRLRTAGVRNLNVDVMYGLPGQTIEHVAETAEFAANIQASRVAVFGYAHVPWFKKHQKSIDPDQLPGGEARFRQAEAAAETLELEGFAPIGFDHFAAPEDSMSIARSQGRLRRNFQGYTTDTADALIGLGASSISYAGGLYWQNAPDTGAYRAMLSDGTAPVVRGARVNEANKTRASIIESILCYGEALLPRDLYLETESRLASLMEAGFVDLGDGRLVATPRGRPYLRNIAATFDADFAAAPGRHSLAV